MERPPPSALLIAALAVLSLGLVAATLTSTVGSGDDSDPLPGSGTSDRVSDQDSDRLLDGPGVLERFVLIVAVVLVVGSVGYIAVRPRRGLVMLGAVVLTGVVIAVAFQLLSGVQSDPTELLNTTQPQNETQNTAQGGGDGNPVGSLPVVLAVVGGGLLLLMMFALLRTGEEGTAEESDDAADEETAALGEIAGRAADRIEADSGDGADTENEVYRAWREMTDQLDIRRAETTTPREFQRRAADAGLAPADVRELTGLFEEVRYGGQSATEDREQRAVTVLRRIESTYGDES